MADKETIVTTDGGGSGAGMIVALIALIILIFGGVFLYQQGVFSGGTRDVNADIKIETPPAKTN